ncbi:hypothetical protein BCR43DRAFT_515648 [Syncephalastrum racemosum]|uniref:Uncharacterized protein n=1 Tax=Syncephalastrum racemosum TaxID=13706 RepID=A0A1X2HA20_SYNRA|nr:hypothetical protein BCR43DRAFT_515648 [Syncephalastrum racemosum]
MTHHKIEGSDTPNYAEVDHRQLVDLDAFGYGKDEWSGIVSAIIEEEEKESSPPNIAGRHYQVDNISPSSFQEPGGSTQLQRHNYASSPSAAGDDFSGDLLMDEDFQNAEVRHSTPVATRPATPLAPADEGHLHALLSQLQVLAEEAAAVINEGETELQQVADTLAVCDHELRDRQEQLRDRWDTVRRHAFHITQQGRSSAQHSGIEEKDLSM